MKKYISSETPHIPISIGEIGTARRVKMHTQNWRAGSSQLWLEREMDYVKVQTPIKHLAIGTSFVVSFSGERLCAKREKCSQSCEYVEQLFISVQTPWFRGQFHFFLQFLDFLSLNILVTFERGLVCSRTTCSKKLRALASDQPDLSPPLSFSPPPSSKRCQPGTFLKLTHLLIFNPLHWNGKQTYNWRA